MGFRVFLVAFAAEERPEREGKSEEQERGGFGDHGFQGHIHAIGVAGVIDLECCVVDLEFGTVGQCGAIG